MERAGIADDSVEGVQHTALQPVAGLALSSRETPIVARVAQFLTGVDSRSTRERNVMSSRRVQAAIVHAGVRVAIRAAGGATRRQGGVTVDNARTANGARTGLHHRLPHHFNAHLQ